MHDSLGYSVFQTAIGQSGVIWGERGIVSLLLPETTVAALKRRIRERYPDAALGKPPERVQRVLEQIAVLLSGGGAQFDIAALNFDGISPFYRRVYEAACTIPPGTTLTYGEVAQRLGSPGAARAVGQALAKNPFAPLVPCHRVVAAGGKWGGFSASGGIVTKRRILELEALKTSSAPVPLLPQPLFVSDKQLQPFAFDPLHAVAHLTSADPKLGRFIESFGGFELKLNGISSAFQALAEAIVYQQLTGKAAATIWGRVCALQTEGGALSPEWVAQASVELLRSAGLSNAKALGIRDLAAKTLSQQLPTLSDFDTMSNEDIVDQLIKVRGIGKWTVQMLLIFRLGRPDVLPVDDYGVRKGFAAVYRKRELPTPKQLEAYGKRWAPYRTVAAWYLWRAADA